MNKSEQINELATALSLAQSQMEGAKKDSTNPFFKSKYADLQACWDAIREPLTKNGLAISQTTEVTANGGTLLCTTLMHKSGQWISGTYAVKPAKDDPQGMGAAISYARRYSLAAIVGIYQMDDDAESAMGRSDPTKPITYQRAHQNQTTALRGKS